MTGLVVLPSCSPMKRAMRSVVAAVALVAGCAEPPPPAVPQAEPASAAPVEAPPPAPEARVDPPVHECGQDPAEESPIVEGKLGDGERVVRLINNSSTTIQARILDTGLEPAMPGTLHVPPGTVGEFYVPEGEYVVRYRHGKTCQVRRGAKLLLTGPRAGVEIGINPHTDKGTQSRMKAVREPL